ncbi:MAG: hypothetical protein M3N93_01890 [Acidobacteriota bacterium]|nr:hypothetical protein [Acidobacteriota bacterium]
MPGRSTHWFLLTLSLSRLLTDPLRAQTLTRFEQDDSRIVYTGTWYPNSNSLESGGKSTLTNLKGSQAIVLFNGTGINWMGTSDGYSGLCYVTLDGAPATVDTSNAAGNTYYQKTLFSVSGLTAGPHRLTIEVIHQRDDTTQGSWIWVDAFDVQNGTLVAGPEIAGAGVADQGNIAANYSGHWFQDAGPLYSNGTVNGAVDPGAKVDFTFNGTGVTWLGFRDPYSGIAQVYIDGNLQATVDTYAGAQQTQTPTWSVSGLSAGTHTLTIQALGTHNGSSTASWVWVDGFQVSGSVTSGAPAISSNGFVSAASFAAAPNNQVAPGQIVSIFGQNFTAATQVNATAIPLPTQLGPQNTSIAACGHALPLYNVFPNQINAQIPLECATSGTVTATISAGGQTGTQTFSLAPAAPGIFTMNASGTGDGIILHADNSLVSAARPATAGETVVIYATGLGATSPVFATGTAASMANNTVMPVTVTIGGKPATVTYAGLTQTLVGLYQINAVIPAGLTGSQPVFITVGSKYTSPAGVTMSLQ